MAYKELKELNELKDIVMTEKDFSVIWNKFFDLAENPSFLHRGKPTKHPILKKIIETIGSSIFPNQKISIMHLMLQKVKGHKFVHGPFMINGHVGSLFYYDEINMGMMAIAKSGGTDLFRISSTILAKEDVQDSFKNGNVFLTPSSKSIH